MMLKFVFIDIWIVLDCVFVKLCLEILGLYYDYYVSIVFFNRIWNVCFYFYGSYFL